MTKTSKIKPAYISIMAIVAWLALIVQLYLSVSYTKTNGLTPLVATWNFFSYFTVLTNFLVAISLSIILLKPASSTAGFFSKPAALTAIALYIFIVGLVYNLILRSVWAPTGLQKWVDEALHVIVPVLFLIFWFLFVPKGTLKWAYAFHWLIFPAAYLAYALFRGEFTNFFAYPFINTLELGYSRVLLNAGGLMIVFIAAGLLFIAADKLMSRSIAKVFS